MRKFLLTTTLLAPFTAQAQIADIVPGGSFIKDAAGNQWAIAPDNGGNRITENGVPVAGGGDTSHLSLVNGTIYGYSAGTRNDKTGWFNLSSTTPGADQSWVFMNGAAPPGLANTVPPANPSNQPSPIANTPLPPVTSPCTAATPNFASSKGGFGTIDGHIYSPNGQIWVARGVDVHDWDLNTLAASLPRVFPGINMVRVAIESLNSNPATYASAVNALTAQGIVVEFSDYTNTTGNNVGGNQGSVYTGSRLAAENAMYAGFATAFKNNPYVWFGTNNEPATDGSLSQWHLATYNAVRGTGNNNPILLDPSGSRPAGYGGTSMMSGLDPSAYANMTNVIWDPHVYPYQDNNSPDQKIANAEVAAMIANVQNIQSADGKVPAIIGEYGPAVGMGDGADRVTINAVQHNQDMGGSGATAWAVNTSGQLNLLTNGTSGKVTDWGQTVADYAKNSGVQPCAQSPIPDPITANATTLADPTTATTVTAPAIAPIANAVTAPPLAPAAMSIDQVAALATGN